jgi:arylsulfatase A-like enzyme
MRGAPQSGFSRLILRISLRISFDTGGRPVLAAADFPGPEQSESFAVPSYDGCRFDDAQSRAPFGPGSTKPSPQAPVQSNLRAEDEVPESKCFGYVQTCEEKPRRRLWELMKSQGLQDNQQVVFMSDGGEDVRRVQTYLHPGSEHWIDWFHITMRITSRCTAK